MNAIDEMLLANEATFKNKKITGIKADIHRLDFEFSDGSSAAVQSDFWKDAPLGHGLLVFQHNAQDEEPAKAGFSPSVCSGSDPQFT